MLSAYFSDYSMHTTSIDSEFSYLEKTNVNSVTSRLNHYPLKLTDKSEDLAKSFSDDWMLQELEKIIKKRIEVQQCPLEKLCEQDAKQILDDFLSSYPEASKDVDLFRPAYAWYPNKKTLTNMIAYFHIDVPNYLKDCAKNLGANEWKTCSWILDKELPTSTLNDLILVGKKKLMGYLPIRTLLCCSADINKIITEAEANGFETKFISQEEGHVHSGALYITDVTNLQRLLSLPENAKVLKDSEWPEDAKAFLDNVATIWVDAKQNEPLYDLIALTFSKENPDYKDCM